jgi:hypothetical protein
MLRVEWTSHASNGTVVQAIERFSGEILRITTNPDGTAAPTDDYDITLVDGDGVDVALGTLANRDDTNTETVYPSVAGSGALTDIRMSVAGLITLTIANAGNSKKGIITIYYR